MATGTRKKRRMRRGLYTALAALLLIALAAGLFFLIRRDAVLPVGKDADVAVVNRRMAALENETLSLYTLRGTKTFEAQVSGAQALSVGQGMGAAYGEGDVYLFTPSGRVTAHIASETPVRRVCCGASVTAVVTQDSLGACQAAVYDCYANQIDSVGQSDLLAEDRFVDAGMYEGTLWLLTVDVSGAQPVSRIYLFDVRKCALLARIDVFDQLVLSVAADEKNVFAIGTQQIICYNYNGIRLWQSAASDLRMVESGVCGGSAAVLFAYDDAQGYKLLHDRTERVIFQTAASVCMDETNVYLLQDGALMCCRIDAERNDKTQPLDGNYTKILSAKGRRVLLFDGTQWISRVI